MKNFQAQWKTLKDYKEDDDPTVPTITKPIPLIKWKEAFQDFLHSIIGVCNLPLAYVICTMVDVPVQAPPLVTN